MDKETAQLALKLIARATLTGDEAIAYLKVKQALLDIINDKVNLNEH